jgi:hypothetical protein
LIEVASVDNKADQVLFSSITGDFVEVRAMANNDSDFTSGLLKYHGQNFPT